MYSKKVSLGQFFTAKEIWLKPQVLDFIQNSGCTIAYDPFAGAGDLLSASIKIGFENTIGLDIDETLDWRINDSLLNIPSIENAIIITNPPYLSNYSASRKKIYSTVKKYFEITKYDDLYLLALDKMLEAQQYVVAIVPETFINSNYQQKNRLYSCTVLEENPFHDTDTPVCVLCFDGVVKGFDQIRIYKNGHFSCSLEELEQLRISPTNAIPIEFNKPDGWLALRAVDTTNPDDMIRFDYKSNFDYDWDNKIKVSSRLLTTISIDININERDKFIELCNKEIEILRKMSDDLILSPFKGNMKNGRRRRRLDYRTARALMEKAYRKLKGEQIYGQPRLF
jgi:hypothetical protein